MNSAHRPHPAPTVNARKKANDCGVIVELVVKNMLLTFFFVVTTFIVNIAYGLTGMETLIAMDMLTNALCVVLMYAMYDKEYKTLCGKCHQRIERWASSHV